MMRLILVFSIFLGMSNGPETLNTLKIPRGLSADFKEESATYNVGTQTPGVAFRVLIDGTQQKVTYVHTFSVSNPIGLKNIKAVIVNGKTTNEMTYALPRVESIPVETGTGTLYTEVGIGANAAVLTFFQDNVKKNSEVHITALGSNGEYLQTLNKNDVKKIIDWFKFRMKITATLEKTLSKK